MTNKIKVIISNAQKAVKIPTGVRMLVRRCCHAVLVQEDFEDSAEISVTFVDDAQIQELNKTHRSIPIRAQKCSAILLFPWSAPSRRRSFTGIPYSARSHF